jgi:hypothetical protein
MAGKGYVRYWRKRVRKNASRGSENYDFSNPASANRYHCRTLSPRGGRRIARWHWSWFSQQMRSKATGRRC